jgi:hypothetical protein
MSTVMDGLRIYIFCAFRFQNKIFFKTENKE